MCQIAFFVIMLSKLKESEQVDLELKKCDMEQVSFQLILHAGNSRSCSMEVLALAKLGDFEGASDKLKEAEEQITLAHSTQTKLLFNEANGNKQIVDVLLVHAQDHLMTAIIILDFSRELLHLYQMLLKK